MVKSGKYDYPEVKIINIWLTKTDLILLERLRDKLITNKKKTVSFTMREALLYANTHIDDFVKESLKRWG